MIKINDYRRKDGKIHKIFIRTKEWPYFKTINEVLSGYVFPNSINKYIDENIDTFTDAFVELHDELMKFIKKVESRVIAFFNEEDEPLIISLELQMAESLFETVNKDDHTELLVSMGFELKFQKIDGVINYQKVMMIANPPDSYWSTGRELIIEIDLSKENADDELAIGWIKCKEHLFGMINEIIDDLQREFPFK